MLPISILSILKLYKGKSTLHKWVFFSRIGLDLRETKELWSSSCWQAQNRGGACHPRWQSPPHRDQPLGTQAPLIHLPSVAHSVSDSVQPPGLEPTRLLCPWNSPGQNTGACSHSLLQRIFSTQGSNQGLLHCRQILYHLSPKASGQKHPLSLIVLMKYQFLILLTKMTFRFTFLWQEPKVKFSNSKVSVKYFTFFNQNRKILYFHFSSTEWVLIILS